MENIEVKEHGLIEYISLPVRPGVNIFRGPNDCGKSVLLEGLSRTLGNQRAKAACRTGQKQGSIEGLGVKLTVSKRTTVKGVLVVDSIEGRYTVADLVDPHIKDPVAADTKRIHALLSLNGVESDPAKFHALLPGGKEEFDRVVGPVEGDGLVELAGIIKRKLEHKSRDNASRAADFKLQAEVCKLACEGVDTSVETDVSKLQAAFEEAVQLRAELRERDRAAMEAIEKSQEASEALKQAQHGQRAFTVERATEAVQDAHKQGLVSKARVSAALVALTEAEQAAASADASLKHLRRELENAQFREQLAVGWQATIDAAIGLSSPTLEEVATTAATLEAARKAIELGVKARDATKNTQQALDHLHESNIHSEAAESLRQAAMATDDVLSDAVDSETLTVVGGRLMTPTEDRGLIPYAERSQGYRANIAICEAIKLIKSQGTHDTAIIPLPQELWAGIQPNIQRAIDLQARKAGVTIYTAEAVDEDLHVTAFDG